MYKTLILLSLICSSVFAQTVSSFVEETTPAPADLLYLVKTPGGPGTSRKVTAANLTKALTAASITEQGVVTTGAQTFAGLKTFPIDISFGDILHPGGIRDIFVGHTNGIFCEAVTGSNNSIHIWLSQSTDNSLAPTFNGYKSRGTVASKTPPITGDDLISFRGLVHTTTGGSSSLPAAQIFFEVGTGTVSTTSTPGRIVMATAKDGSTTNSRRLEIDGDQIVINDSSTDGVVFRVETNNDANAIVTDAVNDRVGIGTATPSTKLDVAGTINATGYTGLPVADATTAGIVSTGTQTFAGEKTFTGLAYFKEQFIFQRDGSATSVLNQTYADSATGTGYVGQKARGSLATPSVPVSGDDILSIRADVWTGTFFTDAARILFEVDGTVSATSKPAKITLKTVKDGTTTNQDRLNIYNDGLVVVNEASNDSDFRVEGDTDANNIFSDASTDRVGIGTATPGAKLEVNGETISQGDITIGTGLIKNPGAGTLDMILTAINDGGTGRVIVQSATDFRFLNHFGSTMFEVDEASRVGIGGGSQPSKMLTVSIDAANRIGQEIKLAASQTANALEVNSLAGSGGDLLSINANGGITSSSDTFILRGTSSGVSQPVTDWAPANVWGEIDSLSASSGGMLINAYSDSGSTRAFRLNAIAGHTAVSTPAIMLNTGKTDGGTGVAALSNTDMLLHVTNDSSGIPCIEVLGGGTTTVTASTPELSVLNLKTTATNDDPTVETSQGRIATTDATVTTIRTIPISAGKTYKIKADIIARRTGGTAGTADDGASYTREWAFTTKSGTVTQLGADGEIFTAEDQAGWNVDATISTTNVLIQVTGAVDNTVTWHLSKCEISSVGS